MYRKKHFKTLIFLSLHIIIAVHVEVAICGNKYFGNSYFCGIGYF